MTTRITLYDYVAKQKHTEDFGSDIPAILYAQSKLSSLDTRWTKFKAEDVESGLVLAGPCTLAEMDAIVGLPLTKHAVEEFGAQAEARLVTELGATPEEAAKAHATVRARFGIGDRLNTPEAYARAQAFAKTGSTNGLDLTKAEEIAGQIRAAYQRISDVSWLLDSGLSDLRLAKIDYRDQTQAEATVFVGASEDAVARRLAKAEVVLQQLRVVGLA